MAAACIAGTVDGSTAGMNLILFEEGELDAPLPYDDPRVRHLLSVLKPQDGEPFDAGIVDGPRLKAWVRERSERGVSFDSRVVAAADRLYPLRLLVGLSRPQTMKHLLRDCATLGVEWIDVFATEKGERSYAESSLWMGGGFRAHLIDGAQQAFGTTLPRVRLLASLSEAVASVGADALPACRIALDNYEASEPLATALRSAGPADKGGATRGASVPVLVLAVGSERGWSSGERDLLRSSGFRLAHLGQRVLRTETACLAAAAIALSQLGLSADATP